MCSQGADSQSGHRSPTLDPSSAHSQGPRSDRQRPGDSGMSGGELITWDFYTQV